MRNVLLSQESAHHTSQIQIHSSSKLRRHHLSSRLNSMSIMKTFKSKLERKSQFRSFSLCIAEQQVEEDFDRVNDEIQVFSIDHDRHVMMTILLKAVFPFENWHQILHVEFIEHFEFARREIQMLEPDSCRISIFNVLLSLQTFFLILHSSTLHHESIVEWSASQVSFTEEKLQHWEIINDALWSGLRRIESVRNWDDQCLVRDEHIVVIDDSRRQKWMLSWSLNDILLRFK